MDRTGIAELDDLAKKRLALCVQFLLNVRKRSTPNRSIGTSYGLKHIVEEACGTYIPEESLVEAARRMGFCMRQVGMIPGNVYLGITTPSLRKFCRDRKLTHTV